MQIIIHDANQNNTKAGCDILKRRCLSFAIMQTQEQMLDRKT